MSADHYILDTRQVVGNCASWWRPDGQGYTCDLDDAGLYEASDADNRTTDVAVPQSVARSLVISHVRIERLSEYVKIARDDAAREAKASRPKCDATTASGNQCTLPRSRDRYGLNLCHVHFRKARRLERIRRADEFADDYGEQVMRGRGWGGHD